MSSFRRRLMMSVKKQDEYTELKYLRSTGTQYINTDFKPNNDTRIIVRAKPISMSTAFFFGARETIYKNAFCGVLESVTKTTSYFRIDYFSNNNESRLKQVTEINNDIHYFEIDKGKIYFDNIQYQNQYESQKFKCNYNLVLFGVNTSNKITKSAVYVYDCKIYDNDVLIRDMIPVLDKNGIACMYDKVNKKFYYNQGTGEFLYQEKENYTELEYLETTGAQWIDAGLDGVSKTVQIQSKFSISKPKSFQCLFCCREGVNSTARALFFIETNWLRNDQAGEKRRIDAGGIINQVKTLDSSQTEFKLDDNVLITYKNNTGYSINSKFTILDSYDDNKNMSDQYGFVGKLYYFKIYDNNELVRNMIPVLDKNGIACMYDKVNSKFYYNSGAGEFLYE